jgi:hypothetical protein
MIGEGMKILRIYKLAVWLSIQNFYLHFTKVTRKCKVESTDHETDLPDAASLELSVKNTDEGSKSEKRKFQDIWKSKFSWLVNDSSKDIMYCDFCRKAGPDI